MNEKDMVEGWGRTVKKLWTGILIAAAFTLTTGCAAIQEGDPAAKTAVQYATLKYIDGDPDRAARVTELASKTQSYVSDDATSGLDEVEKRIRKEIDWNKLESADALVVSNLIDVVRAEIEARIEDKQLDPKDRVAVKNVLSWVEQSAGMAAGGNRDVDDAQADAGPANDPGGRGAGQPAFG